MIPRRFRRPTGWFAVAAVLAVLAGLTTLRAAARGEPTVEVLVAAADIPVGERLGRDGTIVALAGVARRSVLPGMVRSLEEVRGRTVAVPIGAGEPITQATLGGAPSAATAPLAAGERAISVPLLSAGAAAAVLAPGVRVDAVGATTRGVQAAIVVAGAEVIAVTPPPGAQDGALDGGAVLLRTSEADALRLSAALDLAGGVRLLPRPAGEGAGTP